MFYYKKGSTYVASHTEVSAADRISREEYDRIRAIVDNRPTAPDGYGYRLSAGMEWELYELPTETEATAADYQAALAQMGVKI